MQLEQPQNIRPSVSVVTIFFNAEKFIVEAIESVLAQSYTDWELLLADDGSTDNSPVIAQKYVKQYPQKIRYLEHKGHKNCGMSATRNLGWRHARGEYVAFLDSDDVWLSHKLAHQVRLMRDYPEAGMICGAVQYWNSWNGADVDRKEDLLKPIGAPQDILISPPKMFQYMHPLGTGMSPTPSDFLLKRDVLEKIGGCEERFRKQYQLFEDQGFLNKIYLDFPVYVSSENWIRYRRHPDSCTSTVKGKGQYHQTRKFFLEWFEKYLIKHGHRNSEAWHLVQKALADYRQPRDFSFKGIFKRILGETYAQS